MEETIIFSGYTGVDCRMACLYRSRETGLWTAYGYCLSPIGSAIFNSAYKTSEMDRQG